MEKLVQHYLKRGYPKKLIMNNYEKVINLTQAESSEPKERDNLNDPMVMVRNYNPTNPDIKKIISRNWNIISNSDDCAEVLPEPPIVGFKDQKLQSLDNLNQNLKKKYIFLI